MLAAADPRPYNTDTTSCSMPARSNPKTSKLGFLWAMKKTAIPVVLLGDVAPGCQWYLEECQRVGGTQASFSRGKSLDHRLGAASALALAHCLVVGGGGASRVALKTKQ